MKKEEKNEELEDNLKELSNISIENLSDLSAIDIEEEVVKSY